MKLKSDDVVAILDDLGIDKAHYIGYSLGGTTGYGVAKHAPERFNSIIIGGMHPYGSAGTNASVDERIEGLKKGMESVVASMEAASGRQLLPERRAAMLDNDPKALIASVVAVWKASATSGEGTPRFFISSFRSSISAFCAL